MPESCLEIAIVDDEECVRKALGRLLTVAGYKVSLFASGNAFLESLQDSRPDCTILDLHLPEESGLEVRQRLARSGIALPCIIITGKDEPGIRERVLASAAAYLTKPVEERVLLDAISEAVTRGCNETNTIPKIWNAIELRNKPD